jgi:hypothetical protein
MQSCVVFFSYKGRSGETMYVSDMLTNKWYATESCTYANDECAGAAKRTRDKFDELTQTEVTGE